MNKSIKKNENNTNNKNKKKEKKDKKTSYIKKLKNAGFLIEEYNEYTSDYDVPGF